MNDDLPGRMHPLDLDGRFDRGRNHVAAQHQSLAVLVIKLEGVMPMKPGNRRDACEALQGIVAAAVTQAAGTEKLLNALASGEFACLLNGLLTRERQAAAR